ncbi:hypothetical protein BDZ45DRAFT_435563 [Acephala macrosclerotiorum]|nr:hypothetical protein BDZ45DRAFT_435563 [Acephala macrosclerotiorum]
MTPPKDKKTAKKGSKPRTACTIQGCPTTFSRKADCYRHVAEFHGDALKCPVKGCAYQNTKRESRLKAHMTSAHPEVYKDVELEVPEVPADSWPSPRAIGLAYGNEEDNTNQYPPSPLHGSPRSTSVVAAQAPYAQPFPTAGWGQNDQSMNSLNPSQYQYPSTAEDVTSYQGASSGVVGNGNTYGQGESGENW